MTSHPAANSRTHPPANSHSPSNSSSSPTASKVCGSSPNASALMSNGSTSSPPPSEPSENPFVTGKIEHREPLGEIKRTAPGPGEPGFNPFKNSVKRRDQKVVIADWGEYLGDHEYEDDATPEPSVSSSSPKSATKHKTKRSGRHSKSRSSSANKKESISRRSRSPTSTSSGDESNSRRSRERRKWCTIL